jgi:hypothetical protein
MAECPSDIRRVATSSFEMEWPSSLQKGILVRAGPPPAAFTMEPPDAESVPQT